MKKTNLYVLCALGMATIFILTSIIAIPLPQFGYINLGDSGIFVFASILPAPLAFLAGGIGSALGDIYLGYTQYALFTLIIKGLEALCVSIIWKSIPKKVRPLSFLVGLLIMVCGYYLTDAFLYGNFIVAFGSVPFNLLQGFISVVVASILSYSVGNRLYLSQNK